MSKKNKIKAHRMELITLWESSGLSQKKFCEQQGLNYRQFVYWRWLLNRNKLNTSAPKLVRVSASTPCFNRDTPVPNSALEVSLPTGIKLYIKTKEDISKAYSLIQLLGGAR